MVNLSSVEYAVEFGCVCNSDMFRDMSGVRDYAILVGLMFGHMIQIPIGDSYDVL